MTTLTKKQHLMLATAGLVGLPQLASKNLLFTTVKEGTAKAIVKGEGFDRLLMAHKGHHLNDPTKPWYVNSPATPAWQVLPNASGTTDDDYDDRHWLWKELGIHWVGFPWSHGIYYYMFEWNETMTGPDGKEKIRPRKEPTDFVYVIHITYAVVTNQAETKDGLQTDELTFITVQVVNPFLALFGTKDWMRRITSKVNGYIASFVGKMKYDKLKSFCKSADQEGFSKGVIALNEDGVADPTTGKVDLGLRNEYGVEIEAAEMQEMDLSGTEGSELQKAASKAYVAEQTKKARITEAKGEAEAKKIVGAAEAVATEQMGVAEAKALGDRMAILATNPEIGLGLAGFDAMSNAAQKAGNTVVFGNPLDKLVEAAKTLTGGK